MTYVEAAAAPLRKTGQIKLHGKDAFEGMRKAGRLVAECLDMLGGEVRPGVFAAGGYYRYDHGYQPDFAGMDRFEGTIVMISHEGIEQFSAVGIPGFLEHATAKGLAIVDIYVENQTAYKAGRPLFNAMLERNRDNIAKALPGLAKYELTQGEIVASGAYYNALIPNISPAQILQPFLDYAFGFRRGVDAGQPPDNAGPRAEIPFPVNGIPQPEDLPPR